MASKHRIMTSGKTVFVDGYVDTVVGDIANLDMVVQSGGPQFMGSWK